MDYKECPHYSEILTMLTEGEDFEDISFEIDDVQDCKECLETGAVCGLWVMLVFVEDMKPQLNMAEAKVTIDTLNDQILKIALQLIHSLKLNNTDSN